MDKGRLNYLEEALRNINRQIDAIKLNRNLDPRILHGLEGQKLTLEEEIATIKTSSTNKAFSIFGILDSFDDEEIITLPKTPKSDPTS